MPRVLHNPFQSDGSTFAEFVAERWEWAKERKNNMVYKQGRKPFNCNNYLLLGLDAKRAQEATNESDADAKAADKGLDAERAREADTDHESDAKAKAGPTGPAGGGKWESNFNHLPPAPPDYMYTTLGTRLFLLNMVTGEKLEVADKEEADATKTKKAKARMEAKAGAETKTKAKVETYGNVLAKEGDDIKDEVNTELRTKVRRQQAQQASKPMKAGKYMEAYMEDVKADEMKAGKYMEAYMAKPVI